MFYSNISLAPVCLVTFDLHLYVYSYIRLGPVCLTVTFDCMFYSYISLGPVCLLLHLPTCPQCIDDWLMRSFTCPSCMEPVDAALLGMEHGGTWWQGIQGCKV